MEGKKNIGLFMALLENDFSSAIMKGAIIGAKECDVNLIIFPMDLIEARYSHGEVTEHRYQYNVLDSFMNNETLDAILVEYGTIASYLDNDKKKEFLKLAGNKPMIILSEEAEGYQSITVDNKTGLIEVIEHLIEVHNCRKIGFLSGPKENSDAMDRLRTYRDTISKHNIDLGEDWIVYGNFSSYVEDIVTDFYLAHPDLEALVCASDAMAITAIQVADKMGLEPGEKLFITGFDDLAAGFVLDPALTTVKADPAELSALAVHRLCEQTSAKENLVVKTKMVKRESCGCKGFELDEKWKRMLGVSSDWREMARFQMHQNVTRFDLENELGNISRECVYSKTTPKERYGALLSAIRRLNFDSCALYLYDDFIVHEPSDSWHMPEIINLVAFYCSMDEDDYTQDKGEILVPVKEIFDWGIIRNGKRHQICIYPLFFGQYQIGLFAVESTDDNNYLYAYHIAGQISTAFYTVKMNEIQQKLKSDLEEANLAKSHFLANMSHEIRTPINAIIGFNEMVIRESKEKNIIDYSNDIKNAADTLLLLVNDTLDFSKIEAGKMELVPVEYNLMELLHSAVGMMTKRAENKGLDILLEYDEKLPSVLEGDVGRIRQILLNILSNAIKYTEKGKVTLKVSGEAAEDNLALSVHVIDTGIGIKKSDLARLFNEFERIEEKRNRNIEGTGLGINITTGLLKLMGSELKVDSVYGKGSDFSFTINQKIIDNASIIETSATSNMEESKANTMEGIFEAPDVNVLVVDDNFLNRKVFANLLKITKMNVEQAEGGRKCLEMVRDKKYDIIFLDHMMPEMDGIETLEEILANKLVDTATTPIIALTANAIAGAREEYLKMGFTDYLAKPVLPKDLYSTFVKYIPKGKITKWHTN